MNVTPFGAKSPSETVIGVSADENGNLNTKKIWTNEIISLYDDTPTTAATYRTGTILDTGDIGAISIRVSNYTDSDIQIGFYSDVVSSNYALKDGNGELILFVVEAGKTNVMITPDDIPQLQWLAKLRLYFVLPATSSDKKVTIHAVVKR